MLTAFVFTTLFLFSSGNVFLHNPRGSNNRLNEANTNTNIANRLFDSQNNGKGGYCVGPSMSYYEGSQLLIEYTVQHGCDNPKLHCTVILQYMCSASDAPLSTRIRDGTTTTRISNDEQTFQDESFGMHENYAYYQVALSLLLTVQTCDQRSRNAGLWIGSISLSDDSSRNTAQNPSGLRYGFECPEERDYYPYWHSSPWKDIAILTDHPEYCPFYTSESQNVKGKVNSPSHGIPAPECRKSDYSSENLLTTGRSGYLNSYLWTLPRASQENCITNDNCNCVIRIRYNVSSGDMGPGGYDPSNPILNSAQNGNMGPFENSDRRIVGGIPVAVRYYGNPVSRTHQDRSFVFHIRPRTVEGTIHNLNVLGKRGNAVQVFPAMEYSFSPQSLKVDLGDYIHFQWTGCDTNPSGYAGVGTDQTDRSNVVQIAAPDHLFPASDAWLDNNAALFPDPSIRAQMSYLGQTGCDDSADNDDPNNCRLLNRAPAYFDGDLQKMETAGTFYFMSTRNQFFSNRHQKGVIIVEENNSVDAGESVKVSLSLFVILLMIFTLW